MRIDELYEYFILREYILNSWFTLSVHTGVPTYNWYGAYQCIDSTNLLPIDWYVLSMSISRWIGMYRPYREVHHGTMNLD